MAASPLASLIGLGAPSSGHRQASPWSRFEGSRSAGKERAGLKEYSRRRSRSDLVQHLQANDQAVIALGKARSLAAADLHG
jgi:hypothetical protein